MSTQESAAPQPNRPVIAPVGELRAFPRALPTPLMPFVGRVEELRHATATLLDPATRLLTITGPGGVGKTRFSLAIARTDQRALPAWGGVRLRRRNARPLARAAGHRAGAGDPAR